MATGTQLTLLQSRDIAGGESDADAVHGRRVLLQAGLACWLQRGHLRQRQNGDSVSRIVGTAARCGGTIFTALLLAPQVRRCPEEGYTAKCR